jgi:putative ABC transport system permease protein
VSTLGKKLVRDLWRLRYQGFTIAVLVACGIASFVSAVAAAASMQASRDAFYAEARFADIFCSLKRAPRVVLERLRDLPGVSAVDGRLVDDYRVELPETSEPVIARFVSLAWPPAEHLDRVMLRAGRLVEPGSTQEVVVSEAFADAWHLVPGSTLAAVINERRAKLRVVGVAVAPEFAFTFAHTGLPDPKHFGIVWMDEDALAKAMGAVGAFNDVALELGAHADPAETLRRVDAVLEPYGGLGAVDRSDQLSAKLVDQKIEQLAKLAKTLPVIFLGVASFLLNVLLSRIVGTQREQIATLKALGYRERELFRHYLEFAATITAIGIVLGVGLGVLGARSLLHMYALYFKFPAFIFRFNAWAIVFAALVALAAGLAGTAFAVRKAVAIPAAEAMRPEAPPAYHATAFDRLYAALSPIARMVLRDVQRRPGRLCLSAGSIALATAIVLAGSVFGDSLDEVLRLQFEVAHREAVTVTLDEARPWSAVEDAAALPGVVNAEGERLVPVRLRAGPRFRTTAILGLPPRSDLHRLLDATGRPLALPPGLSLSRVLADSIGVKSGDSVEVDVLEGERPKLRVPVAALVDDLLGLSAYMNARELARLLDEEPRANVLLLDVRPSDIDAVSERLRAVPAAAGVSRPALDRGLVQAQVADVFTVLSILLALFATAIAIGVVYNNARIALEVRSRDLATMRILGFTRGELAGILLGEQGIQVLLGVAPGLLLGRTLAGLWLSTIDHELLRIPLAIAPSSYAAAVCVVAFAALTSALSVRRQADRLDLVAVLKARD